MIYLDANIFIYAYFKPKKGKSLSNKIKWCKEEAQKIVQKINEEENNYCISLIQLSEVVNLLKNVMSWENLQEFIMGLISNKSVEIIEVSKMLYINAVNKMTEYNMDSNDLSAYLLMKEKNIKEIYTFDQQYEDLPDITWLPQMPKELS
ncbi:MAG: type II toxin-antitoxin system VapC family toxin [Candidatus Lokiarchaeota archaeon]|nr:type II toxin-antitoxin system VapC family toxin [Candidatus Lokiarchaeota archaeon]